MSKDRNPAGGPFIRNGEMVGAGNKYEQVYNEDGSKNFTKSVEQQANKRPSIDKDLVQRKDEIEQGKQQDKTQKDMQKNKDEKKEEPNKEH